MKRGRENLTSSNRPFLLWRGLYVVCLSWITWAVHISEPEVRPMRIRGRNTRGSKGAPATRIVAANPHASHRQALHTKVHVPDPSRPPAGGLLHSSKGRLFDLGANEGRTVARTFAPNPDPRSRPVARRPCFRKDSSSSAMGNDQCGLHSDSPKE